MRVKLTLKSRNAKTGPIPVSTTESKSCPDSCPMKQACYAKSGPLRFVWNKVDSGIFGTSWREFCAGVAALPAKQLWRHNQAGDLPGNGERINRRMLRQLTRANRGKRGFTYTHKLPRVAQNLAAILEANRDGFTINLSANNLAQADEYATLGAPVVVVLPDDSQRKVTTPAGNTVALCPAQYRDSTCADCGLCAQRDRKVIVGFAAHGTAHKLAAKIAA